MLPGTLPSSCPTKPRITKQVPAQKWGAGRMFRPWFPYRLPAGRLGRTQHSEPLVIFAFLPRRKSQEHQLLGCGFLIFLALANQ